MSRVQERVPGPRKTTFIKLEEQINAVSQCRDESQVVVAGRNVFKIIGLDDDGFKEKVNLRVGRRINLNFSITDVQWHPSDDYTIATAAGNGAIVIWNLNKATKQKQELVFTDHKRTVNRICFHPVDANLLISGSQDGCVKCFDIRKKDVVFTCKGMSESIRDVQFSPFDESTYFVAGCESGNVQLWDRRRTDSHVYQFMAHNGPVFSVEWHPDIRGWLATAGRDKMVKVWDIQYRATPKYSINTIASVARIKWRPSRKYHIASCAFVVDCSINVWDIRRPYVPFASFSEHKDVTTGILWQRDPHFLLSCSKDCTLFYHIFSDAYRPASHIPPVGVSMNVYGDVAHAAWDQLKPGKTVKIRSSTVQYTSTFGFRKSHTQAEEFQLATNSILNIFNSYQQTGGLSIKYIAQEYKLTGRSISELCDHNAGVASKYSLHQQAQTWMILKVLYSTDHGKVSNLGTTSLSNSFAAPASTANKSAEITGPQGALTPVPTVTDGSIGYQGKANKLNQDDNQSSISSGSNEENEKLASISGLVNTDFFFGDEQEDSHFDFGESLTMRHAQDWTLPAEAFQPRQQIEERTPSPDDDQERPDSPISNVDSEPASSSTYQVSSKPAEGPATPELPLQTMGIYQKCDFSSLVVDMLHFFAEQGDIQSTVSMLIVLGDKLYNNIDHQLQEQWVMAYIDLLGRLELWTVAAEVISLCKVEAVCTLNQASTTVHTACAKCSKPLIKSGLYCERCQDFVKPCSVCHMVVRGLQVWCQGCGHGGHIQHIKEWFEQNVWCPMGCGHLCQLAGL